MWSDTDTQYWISKERELERIVVDLGEYGFVIASRSHAKGWTDDPRLFGRIGAVQALVKAREALPDGMNIKVYDGWRPWTLQKRSAAAARIKIAEAHPEWSEEDVDEHQWKMAPPSRIVPRFGSHRHGGGFDITLVDAAGDEVDMGVAVGYNTGPEATLLYYEFLEDPNEKELEAQKNRRIMVTAMRKAEFSPYLEEFWHWNYLRDMEDAAKEQVMSKD